MTLKTDVEAMIAACPAVEEATTALVDALVILGAAEATIFANENTGKLISTMSNAGRRGTVNLALARLTDAITGRVPDVSLSEFLTSAWQAELAEAQ